MLVILCVRFVFGKSLGVYHVHVHVYMFCPVKCVLPCTCLHVYTCMYMYIVYTGSKAPPPGAVAVLPPGAVPLLNTTKEGEILCTNEVQCSTLGPWNVHFFVFFL